jgi:hypothetical protein
LYSEAPPAGNVEDLSGGKAELINDLVVDVPDVDPEIGGELMNDLVVKGVEEESATGLEFGGPECYVIVYENDDFTGKALEF